MSPFSHPVIAFQFCFWTALLACSCNLLAHICTYFPVLRVLQDTGTVVGSTQAMVDWESLIPPIVHALKQLPLSRGYIHLIKSKRFILIWGHLTLHWEKQWKEKSERKRRKCLNPNLSHGGLLMCRLCVHVCLCLSTCDGVCLFSPWLSAVKVTVLAATGPGQHWQL